MATYQSHWGLKNIPFRSTPDPDLFFPSPVHDEALARLEFLVENRQRLGVLLGPQGSGKSLVFRVFRQRMERFGHQVADIHMLGLSTDEFLWKLAAQLGLNPSDDWPTFVLWRSIVDRMIELRFQRKQVVLLLDEADCADRDVLVQVQRLLHCDASPDFRLTVVLAADSSQVGRMGRRLLDLAELRIDLEPWDESDTHDFLRASITKAGRTTPVFRPQAASRLHALADGIPRRVSQLAELALLAGAGQRLDQIDGDTVEMVFGELSVSAATAVT